MVGFIVYMYFCVFIMFCSLVLGVILGRNEYDVMCFVVFVYIRFLCIVNCKFKKIYVFLI